MADKEELKKESEEFNKQAEKQAKGKSLKKLDRIESYLSNRFGGTLSTNKIERKFPLYSWFGYYSFYAPTEYVGQKVVSEKYQVGTGRYSGIVDVDTGSVSISEVMETVKDYHIEERNFYQEEKRYIKVVEKDCVKEVAALEKTFRKDLDGSNLFYEIKSGGKLKRPNIMMFLLLGLTMLLFTLCALAFYATTAFSGRQIMFEAVGEYLSTCYWEHGMLSKIEVIGNFINENPSLIYFIMGGLLLLYLIIRFAFKSYVYKSSGPKYIVDGWFKVLTVLFILLIIHVVLEELFVLGILTDIFKKLLGEFFRLFMLIFSAIYSVTRVCMIVCFIIMTVITIFGVVIGYSLSVKRVRARCEFKNSKKYDEYLKNYNAIIKKTLFFYELSFRHAISYEEFQRIKSTLSKYKKI